MRQKLFIKRKGGEFMKRWLGVVVAVPLTAYVVLIVSFLLLSSTSAFAVHKGAGDLTCGNCHTMHNSQGGGANTLGGATGGSLVLLRADLGTGGRENIHRLCLQCHSDAGSQANTQHAPKTVYAPKVHSLGATWNQDTHLTAIGAGGNFYPQVNADATFSLSETSVALGTGHSLGLTAVTPPGGDTAIAGFSCTSCHDPHGTASATDALVNKFRNLRRSATEAGLNAGVQLTAADHTSWVGGIQGTNFTGIALTGGAGVGAIAWPVINASPTNTPLTDSAASNSYGGGTGGISKWCAQCHDNWHEAIVAGNASGSDWKRHPVDNLLNDGTTTSGALVTIIDTTNYSAIATTPGQYLPVADGAATNRVFYLTSATEDKVMCLSCHFAHGGPYYDNLRWNYTSAVSAGGQTGNGIPSTRGCQLCHNR